MIEASQPSLLNTASNPWRHHAVRIERVKSEVDQVATYDLSFVDKTQQQAYRFAPGQFNMLYLPGAGEMAISISDDPDRRDAVAHTIRTAGNVTRTLSRMTVGDTLGLRGPFGTAWPLSQCVGKDVVLVAGGIGLAPLRPAIYALLEQPQHFGRIQLLVGVRSPEVVLYQKEFDAWTDRGLEIQTTVDRAGCNWVGNVGVVTLLLDRLQPFDPQQSAMWCCGPEIMMRFCVQAATRRGLPDDQIWVSTERNMQCAIGLCGHCQLGPEFICKDGPIFRYDRVSPFIDVEGL